MSRRRLFFSASGVDTDSFIMSVKTDNAGTSSSTQFTIPTLSTGYNYTVKTSDGQTITGNTGNLTITFPIAGTYDVKITGDFPRIYFNNGGDRLKLLEVKQWGTIIWLNFSNAFYGCSNSIFSNIPDIPNGGLSNIGGIFRDCTSLTTVGRINEWIVSGAITFQNTFSGCTNFNQNIGAWRFATSGTISFNNFFSGCTNFNNGGSDEINGWNTERVNNLNATFVFCVAFNKNIGNWNVSLCTNFTNTFNGCTLFNNGGSDTIKNWNVSSGTTFLQMFLNCRDFNQPIGAWSINASVIQLMLSNTASFQQNIGSWSLVNVTNALNFMSLKTPATFSTTNLNSIYNGWTNALIKPSLTTSFGTAKYTSAGTEGRALLTRTNTTKTITNAVNNGSGLIRISATAHGLTTGNKCFISGVVGTTEANGAWIVTVIDANTIDLQSSTFTNAYTSGGTLRTGYGWTITDGGI